MASCAANGTVCHTNKLAAGVNSFQEKANPAGATRGTLCVLYSTLLAYRHKCHSAFGISVTQHALRMYFSATNGIVCHTNKLAPGANSLQKKANPPGALWGTCACCTALCWLTCSTRHSVFGILVTWHALPQRTYFKGYQWQQQQGGSRCRQLSG
jgi:hypothetical protein